MANHLRSEAHLDTAPPGRVPSHALAVFALLTFAISWGITGAYIFFPEQTSAAFGEISGAHPLFFIATWGPAIAGIVVVMSHGGVRGLGAFLTRLLLWRCGWHWWAVVLVGLPLVFVAGSLAKCGPLLAPLPPEGPGSVVALMFMMLLLGPVEEFGWRGVAQPLL